MDKDPNLNEDETLEEEKTEDTEAIEVIPEETNQEEEITPKENEESNEAEETLSEDDEDEEEKELCDETENFKNGVPVAGEVEILSEKQQKKYDKAEKREQKRLQAELQKKIKAHRKYVKKNPSTLVRYETDVENGLPNDVVEQRILDELENKTNNTKSKSIGRIIFTNVVTFFNILIFIIAGFLMSVGAVTDLTFLVIVTINIVIGIVQEIRAKKMIDELSLMSSPVAIVIREGNKKEIATSEVVLDDLLVLEAGRQICADSIVLEGQVEVNESLLTGEADAIIKKPGDVLYSGSFVISGTCKARVDKIGKDNYIEKLSGQAKVYKKPKSDLLISLNRIIQFMSVPVIVIGVSLFLIMYLKNGVDFTTSIRRTAGAMIGMIPSGLFLMSSIALFVGVIRLAQKNVLVQELYCIEMLARVNCICLDKTGTITDGTMVVKNVIDYNTIYGLSTKNIISAILNALHDQNLTSKALETYFGLSKRIKHIASIPFSSQRKYQAVTFDKLGTFVLGAPEFVLGAKFKTVEKEVDKYAKMGYRVLCLAHKEGVIVENELPEGDIVVASLILIEDNIRPDAIETIKYFKNSGVEVRVISGDNPMTVAKISERAGVDGADRYISLDGMSDSDVVKAALRYTVFGRVSPNQKKLIIQTLKEAGKTVAMTGDGVNDILALREADCSIGLASGSDAARNCSHLVLLDNNFGSMPQVVAEGRRVINNVTSVASLFLTKTIFSLFLAIEALITGTYPISAIQLIIIDTMAIGLPSLILVNEPNNNPVEGRFLPNVLKKALPGAIVILIISIIVFSLSGSLSLDNMSLTTIIIIAATHTCLMVLFKACKPFTAIHKALFTVCYGVFLFAIFVLPQLLELRPIFSFSEYYSASVTSEYVSNYPSIEISKDNFYVIDGKVSTLQTNNNYNTDTLTRYDDTKDSNPSSRLYYAINGEKTDYEISIPTITYNSNGNIFLGGYKINDINYFSGIEDHLVVDEEGHLFIEKDGENKPVYITLKKSSDYYKFSAKYGIYNENEAIKQYCILPTVEIANGAYIINGVTPTNGKYQASSSDITSNTTLKITINPKTRELLINGKTVYLTPNEGLPDVSATYKVELPKLTTTGNRIDDREAVYIDSVDTSLNIFEIYGFKQQTVSDSYDNVYNYTLYRNTDSGKVYYKYFQNTGKIYEYTKVLKPVKDADGNPVLDVDGKQTYDDITDDYTKYNENTNVYVYVNEAGTEIKYSATELKATAIVNNFTFDGFDTEDDFNKYYDLNGNAISVNNSQTPLSVTVEKGKSNYSLYQQKVLADGTTTSSYISYIQSKTTLDNSMFAPTIEKTAKGYYIINGYYSNYKYNGGELNPHKAQSSNNLVLGGTVTDYVISTNDIVTEKGGMVKELALTSKIFLLMLCLLSGPLMKLMRNIVPWVRKQAYSIQDFISKF